MYAVTRDGRTLARYGTYLEAFQDLQRRQGQSIYWAIKYEGYNIIEMHGRDEFASERLAAASEDM
jgi:hypothetical protein